MVGRTLAVDKFCLKNVDYVRIKIGCVDVSLVPPVVLHVNIGGQFYDIEFTREIPQGRLVANNEKAAVKNVRGFGNADKTLNDHTPKRHKQNDQSSSRNVSSAPRGFTRDARRSYATLAAGGNMMAIDSVPYSENGKRKAPELNVASDSENSFEENIRQLGYLDNRPNGEWDTSKAAVTPSRDY